MLTTEKPGWGRRRGGERAFPLLRFAAAVVLSGTCALTKRRWGGLEHVPLDGPVIFVWNHYSDIDPLPVAHFVYNSGRNPRFLLKNTLAEIPVIGPLLKGTGQIPVYRDRADAADSLREAIRALEAGQAVLIAPEGTVSREPDHWPMRGKTGVARLALETGAPVVPLVQWGSLAIHNRWRKPKFRLGRRKPVTVVALEPVDLSEWEGAAMNREVLTAVTDRIMETLRDGLAELRGETAPPLFDPAEHRRRQRDTTRDAEQGDEE
jgi:1-acyl-sn-glycerol-3-phosphate acyltransferase